MEMPKPTAGHEKLEALAGAWTGEEKTLASHSAMGHHRISYDFSEEGTLRSRMEMSSDGKQWKPLFDGVYHR